ncbi:MAG TPA: carbonic anhydrase [Thermoanaerobaculia bacterium]|nr:carbonic anhydrase [Thermoanaerobaculia bacterium]
MRQFVLLIVLLSSSPIFAQTPHDLWLRLKGGNDFFTQALVTDAQLRLQRRTMDQARKDYATTQNPPVTILSCSDSRVPPELVFSQTIGELFVVRTAGNIASTLDIASIEYALLPHTNFPNGWTRLIVVLAHQHCGAVAAALDLSKDEQLTPGLHELVTQIRRSFTPIPGWPLGLVSPYDAEIANARFAANDLLARSGVIRDAVTNKGVKIYVAYYKTEGGKVELIDP